MYFSTKPTSLASIVFSLISGSLAAPSPVPAPIFGFGQTKTDTSTTPVSNGTIQDTLVRPALFARTAYCSAKSVLNWSCGPPCDALPGVEVLIAGGDDKEIPMYFVAHDPGSQSIVVAHQGTEPHQFLSILNDAEFGLVSLNKTSFPSPPSGVEVHDGFQQTFDRTADQMFAAVQSGLTSKNVNKVQLIGHSLGAAIAVMDAMFLKQKLDSSVEMSTTVFGLPRGGNQDWANFVDKTLGNTLIHVSNKNDPVPTVPPRVLDFQHPSGEIHINVDNSTVACPGQENSNCSDANSLLKISVANHLGPYFNDISFGGKACPA